MMRLPPAERIGHTDLRTDRGRPVQLIASTRGGERIVVRQHFERAVGMRCEIAAAHDPESELQCTEERARCAKRKGGRANPSRETYSRETDERGHRERKVGGEVVDTAICGIDARSENGAFGNGIRMYDRERRRSAAAQRKDAAIHHGPDARYELPIALTVHHRRAHDRSPYASAALSIEHESLGFLLRAAVRIGLGQSRQRGTLANRRHLVARVSVHGCAADVNETRAGVRTGVDDIRSSLNVPESKGLPVGLGTDGGRGMKDCVAIGRRTCERARVGELARHYIHTKSPQPFRGRGSAHERADGAAALDQTLHEVRSEHPGSAGHERASHAENMS